MRIIAEAAGVSLAVPDDAYLSFFNSPYAGHSLGSAVDVYPFERTWGCPVPSPANGVIKEIKKMKMGRRKPFETADHDFAVGIAPEGSDDLLIRVMHLSPSLSPGDHVEMGSVLGETLRSRYFNYWTGPHFHMEIMRSRNFHRATKSMPLEVDLGESRLRQASGSPHDQEVMEASADWVTVRGTGFDICQCGHYYGIAGFTNKSGSGGILDAGLTHYGHGALVGSEQPEESETIQFQSVEVGRMHWSRRNLHFFVRTNELALSLGEHALRGLSAFLYPKQYLKEGVPPLVCIPLQQGGPLSQLDPGDTHELHINSIKAT